MVEMCKYKILIVRGRQQEHEDDPAKFPQDEVTDHEDGLLYQMTYAWEKCDLLGLNDQKDILNTITEKIGLENNQSDDEDQNEEDFME